ncbi:MAG: PQQ-dependent sugar dehydrogenase [Saprospiraceae bacterium]|nr:PQQ-dependent sugar dehydrogenase [Saprospiraceae bacterium]
MSNAKILFLLILAVFALFSCTKKQILDEHSVETSLADLKVYDGLEVTLFASEPMFSNPTNIAVDARGRVWVTEAYNYRIALNPKNPVKKEGDRIMILEDTNGDGKADKSKVFYQGTDVNAALGIAVLGNKVIVSCSPNIFVFTDENGDDVPDKKEILFQGIQGNQDDHGVHAVIFAPDGRLYFNMGNAGKTLLSAAGDTVIDIHGRKILTDGKPLRQGMALRCEMDGSNVEVLGHNFRNIYELAVDPYGTIWQSDNDDDGNKGTRINYVMEQGNFGYTDEMTGASWQARRTNIESEIPLRHWHLNDPGVVPNVLQTGAGSPSGMMMYEGTMLPKVFQGQMIHAEPGHNVVRAYITEKDGAGYKAQIVNLLEGQTDQWFRPADVAAAPDGSLFVADWYDPGVGGHQAGDVDRGRIYRIAPPKTDYKISSVDVKSPDGAAQALLNPNMDIFYQGWTALASFGKEAESALQKLWTSDNPRHRAQALWLLAKLENGDSYINEALADSDENIRATGIRVARRLNKDIIRIAKQLVNDSSPQVKREVAIAIRNHKSPEAPALWAELAMQYDGKDRWYLEALGIGAQGNEDAYFNAWKKQIGNDWNTPAGRQIMWRSRSKAAIPLLGEIIKSVSEKEMLPYFRAFDFHTDPSKQRVLAQIATQSQGEKVLYALKHMDASNFRITPALQVTLDKTLNKYKGKLEFVEIVSAFKLQNKSNDLLSLSTTYPDSIVGKEAVKVLLNWNKIDLLKKTFAKDNEESTGLVKALWAHMYDEKAIAIMENLVQDTTNSKELRQLAVRTFAGPWGAEDRLLALAADKKIPADIQMAAAGVFQTAWRSNIREDGAKYLPLPGSKAGTALPSISILVDKSGDASKGKEICNTLCINCHAINGQGINFGPDLSEIGDKLSKEALYASILYPSQGISFGYEAYKIQLKDGSSAFGRIVSETNDNIEMQFMHQHQIINKFDITSRTQVPTSLMTENLQAAMTEQELVDLIEYLGTLRKVQ